MKTDLLLFLLIIFFLMTSPIQAQQLPVTTTSKEARAHFELGRLDAFHYQGEQARKHLDMAIALDSTFVLAYLHRGGMSRTMTEAMSFFNRAATNRELVTQGEQHLIDAFFAFLVEGEPERAIDIFQSLSNQYPDDPYLPTYLGLRFYRNLELYDKAAEQFERALERDSVFVQAYNWLGYVKLAQQDYEGAEDAFKNYIQGASDEPRPYNSLGDLYLLTGQYEQAADQFEEALRRYPSFLIARDKLILARIRQVYERFEKAFEHQDAKAIASLYTYNGELFPSGYTVINGTEAIETYWQDAFDSGLTGIDFETIEIFAESDGETETNDLFRYDGTIATEVGRYQFFTDDTKTETGKYIVIWRQTPNGWRLHRDIWTKDSSSSDI